MPDCHQGNLLREPLIGVADLAGHRERLSLPAVLARLSDPAQQIVAFTALQAHQAHAWHAFLVQLAAMVCHRTGTEVANDPCRDEGWWREQLIAMAGCEEAWCLVVEDLIKPAFLQTPLGKGSLDCFAKKPRHSAIECDALNLSRNHDLKMTRYRSSPEHWLLALVAFQTVNGMTKAGQAGNYYGPFRQNGSTGNRFAVGFRHAVDLALWHRRDMCALMEMRNATIGAGGFADAGIALLWTMPWDGKKASAVPHSQLDPWCIEVCRRIRLIRGEGGQWLARTAASESERTSIAKRSKGQGNEWVIKNAYGDPWIACNRENKALTPSEQGFTVAKVVEYLFDAVSPPTQQLLDSDSEADLEWYGRALVRGQGKTNGWHERSVPIPSRVARSFRGRPDSRTRASQRAKEQLSDLDSLRKDILRPGILGTRKDPRDSKKIIHEMLCAGGRRPESLLPHFDTAADARFFPHLWDHLDDDPEDARTSWRRLIVGLAREILAEAQAALPDGVRRWRALAASQRNFERGLATKPSKDASFKASLRTEENPVEESA